MATDIYFILGNATMVNDIHKLAREIELMKRQIIKSNKKVAREIAKWADTAMNKMSQS